MDADHARKARAISNKQRLLWLLKTEQIIPKDANLLQHNILNLSESVNDEINFEDLVGFMIIMIASLYLLRQLLQL